LGTPPLITTRVFKDDVNKSTSENVLRLVRDILGETDEKIDDD
jgi:hypothetical protein